MLIDPNSPVPDRALRWFAGLWFPALCVMVGLAARRHDALLVAYFVWTAAALISIAGLIRPSVVRPIYRVLIWVTYPIGWLTSHVLLFVLYYVVITPVGVLVRMFHDPMGRRFDRAEASYWTPRESPQPNRYFRQF